MGSEEQKYSGNEFTISIDIKNNIFISHEREKPTVLFLMHNSALNSHIYKSVAEKLTTASPSTTPRLKMLVPGAVLLLMVVLYGVLRKVGAFKFLWTLTNTVAVLTAALEGVPRSLQVTKTPNC